MQINNEQELKQAEQEIKELESELQANYFPGWDQELQKLKIAVLTYKARKENQALGVGL